MDRVVEVPLGGEHRDNLHAGDEPQLPERVEVEGVVGGDGQLPALHPQGDERIFLGELARHQLHRRPVDPLLLQVHEGDLQPLLEREHEVVLGDVAVFHEQVAQAAALFLLEREGLVQFFWGQESGFDQDLSQR